MRGHELLLGLWGPGPGGRGTQIVYTVQWLPVTVMLVLWVRLGPSSLLVAAATAVVLVVDQGHWQLGCHGWLGWEPTGRPGDSDWSAWSRGGWWGSWPRASCQWPQGWWPGCHGAPPASRLGSDLESPGPGLGVVAGVSGASSHLELTIDTWR